MAAWQPTIQCIDGATTHLKGVKVAAYPGMVLGCFFVVGPFDLGLIPFSPPLSRQEASHPIFLLLGFRASPSFPPLEVRRAEAQFDQKRLPDPRGDPYSRKRLADGGLRRLAADGGLRACWPMEGFAMVGLGYSPS